MLNLKTKYCLGKSEICGSEGGAFIPNKMGNKKHKKHRSYDYLKKVKLERKAEAEAQDEPNIEPRKTRLQLKLINSATSTWKATSITTNEIKKSSKERERDKDSNSSSSSSKRQISTRRYSGKPIVIDEEQHGESPPKIKNTVPKVIDNTETLQLLCWKEDLSPIQLEVQKKRDKEYNELIQKLENLVKQSGGEIIHRGEGLQGFQFNASAPTTITTYVPQQSNGVPDTPTPTAITTIPSQNNLVLQTKGPPAGNYKLVLDPRLGMVIGTMTPTGQITTTTNPQQPTITQTTNQVVQQPQTLRVNQQKKRGRPLGGSNTPGGINNFSTPQIQPASSTNIANVQTNPPPTPNIRPAESTAVGGLSAGTTAAKQPAAIVDLTADDGRPAADSREVAFNKLQGKTFPSLVVVARPHLHAKEAATANDRTGLDTKVKSVLVHTPTKFTEWLIQQGLVRSEQHCTVHPTNKLNLGMYSDVSKFPYSGGYVWISECCPHRFVSVFSGSLFEGAAHPPTVLLKLIYHWACQTNIQNVVQWVKVDNLYVKGLFTWLRAVCSYALQQHLKPMGGPGKKIEVGVISLGTTSQDGTQRQVKVEVLGILDPEQRLIRLRAVEPLADGERNYKRRFSKILEPLRNWVHRDSIISTDLTVDKGTLHYMGFSNIIQSTQTGIPGNQGVMEYLRKIVPRMFQNTLSLLSRQIIQQFLDELVWREWYGQTAAQSFNNMVIHLAEQTRISSMSETLIQRLNKVAGNPFKNYAILYQSLQQSAEKIDASSGGVKRYTGRKRAAGTPTAIIDLEKPSPKKIHISEATSGPTQVNNDPMVPIETYYYGTQEGDSNAALAQKITLNVRCCVCKVPYTNNIKLLDHLLAHAHNISAKNAVSQCRYCLASLPSVEELNTHIGDLHPVETRGYGNVHPACVICEQRFTSIYMLGKHMSREHVPQELPYQCGTCGYRTSSHRHVIDHFYHNHDGGATLQCPFCLKSTAVWSSGRIMSTNVTFFLAHLQKHQKKSMAKKCNKCALWFIQKDSLKDHIKVHAPMVGRKGVRAWPLPSNYVMVPKSKSYSTGTDSPPPFYQQPASPPEEVISLHQLVLDIPPNMDCKECNRPIDDAEHYPQKLSCGSCRYVTDCINTMQLHKIKCRKTQVPTIPRFPLSAPLHCICGYTNSECGNQMAKHLALCERKTAYPTAESAKDAVDSNTHSMLDVLGLMRKNDDSKADGDVSSTEELEPDTIVKEEHKPNISKIEEVIPIDDDEDPKTSTTAEPDNQEKPVISVKKIEENTEKPSETRTTNELVPSTDLPDQLFEVQGNLDEEPPTTEQTDDNDKEVEKLTDDTKKDVIEEPPEKSVVEPMETAEIEEPMETDEVATKNTDVIKNVDKDVEDKVVNESLEAVIEDLIEQTETKETSPADAILETPTSDVLETPSNTADVVLETPSNPTDVLETPINPSDVLETPSNPTDVLETPPNVLEEVTPETSSNNQTD